MKGQVYSIYLLNRNDWGLAKPGQFVYDEDELSRKLIGFVSSVENKTIRVCLFQPLELPEKAFDIIESLERSDVIALARNALECNPSMRWEWEDLL